MMTSRLSIESICHICTQQDQPAHLLIFLTDYFSPFSVRMHTSQTNMAFTVHICDMIQFSFHGLSIFCFCTGW